jgi:hypothetical protein
LGSCARVQALCHALKGNNREWGASPNGKLVRHLIVDPFQGTGTTGAAALLEGMEYIGGDTAEEVLVPVEERLTRTIDVIKRQEGPHAKSDNESSSGEDDCKWPGSVHPRTLCLALEGQWFNLAGEGKNVEYRENTVWMRQRLFEGKIAKEFDFVEFCLGYATDRPRKTFRFLEAVLKEGGIDCEYPGQVRLEKPGPLWHISFGAQHANRARPREPFPIA